MATEYLRFFADQVLEECQMWWSHASAPTYIVDGKNQGVLFHGSNLILANENLWPAVGIAHQTPEVDFYATCAAESRAIPTPHPTYAFSEVLADSLFNRRDQLLSFVTQPETALNSEHLTENQLRIFRSCLGETDLELAEATWQTARMHRDAVKFANEYKRIIFPRKPCTETEGGVKAFIASMNSVMNYVRPKTHGEPIQAEIMIESILKVVCHKK